MTEFQIPGQGSFLLSLTLFLFFIKHNILGKRILTLQTHTYSPNTECLIESVIIVSHRDVGQTTLVMTQRVIVT